MCCMPHIALNLRFTHTHTHTHEKFDFGANVGGRKLSTYGSSFSFVFLGVIQLFDMHFPRIYTIIMP